MESNKKNILIYAIVAIVILIVAGLVYSNEGGQTNSENGEAQALKDVKKEEINFELENYVGDLIKRKDFKTDIVVVNAWATWCPFCVNELPDFAILQEEHPEDISVVAINRAEPLSVAKSYSDKIEPQEGITFLVDKNDSFYKSIGGFSMPETVFLNKKGEVLLHKRGPMKIEEMRSIVESLIE